MKYWDVSATDPAGRLISWNMNQGRVKWLQHITTLLPTREEGRRRGAYLVRVCVGVCEWGGVDTEVGGNDGCQGGWNSFTWVGHGPFLSDSQQPCPHCLHRGSRLRPGASAPAHLPCLARTVNAVQGVWYCMRNAV